MRKDTDKVAVIEKNQLITRPVLEKRSPFVTWVVRPFGWFFLLVGLIWTVMLLGFLKPWEFLTLVDWDYFGEATGGSIGLATLGAIILSFEHVIHQLRLQQQTEKTQYQPFVTCAALLYYSVEGIEDKKAKVKITNPVLKLRIQNLGDSPATFIDVEIRKFCFIPGMSRISCLDKLKIKLRHIDYLGQRVSEADGTQEVELSLSEELPEEVATLIDSILLESSSDPGKLELKLRIRHANIMGLEYTRHGTFSWSRELCSGDKSNQEQVEYIKNFQKARASSSSEKTSIGQFIRFSQPLQATVEP
ncbi:hypothetical protein HYR99_36885 [Candidatus Poribacteria bacterium]|nr:hypothetical protein [Candidatus Poribacteria bacterium]